MQNRDLDARLSAAEAKQAEFQSPVFRDYALAQRIRSNEASVEDEVGHFLTVPAADEINAGSTGSGGASTNLTAFATSDTLFQPASDEGDDVQQGLQFEIEALLEVTQLSGTPNLRAQIRLGGTGGTLLAEQPDYTSGVNDFIVLRANATVLSLGATGEIVGLASVSTTGETGVVSQIVAQHNFNTSPQPSISICVRFDAENASNKVSLRSLNVRRIAKRAAQG